MIQNATRQKKLLDERKRKLESMDETTRKKLMGKATSDLGRPEKCDKLELIKAICRITIQVLPPMTDAQQSDKNS